MVDYISGIIAQNALSSHVQPCIEAQAVAAAATYKSEAEQPVQQAMTQLGTDAKATSAVDLASPMMSEVLERLTAVGVEQVSLFPCGGDCRC